MSFFLQTSFHWPMIGSKLTDMGLWGDYIGGVWGTIFSGVTLFLVYLTWGQSKRSDTRNGVLAVLAEMLKTHDSLMENHPNLSSKILREFHSIYKQTVKIEPNYSVWSVDDRIDISYTYSYYGLTSQAMKSLSKYGDNSIKKIHDNLSIIKSRISKQKSWFIGHQTTLSKYIRNLYSMYKLIDKSKLSNYEKLNFGKIIRSRLSNYDQAILLLNIISHMGREWEAEGLVIKYKPFANIPLLFFGFDPRFSPKTRFPYVKFEWEKFITKKPKYWTAHFKGWSIALSKS